MNEKNDGGAAFPFGVKVISRNPYGERPDRVESQNEPGMTLRDYFAGQALAGLCANEVRRAAVSKALREADPAQDSLEREADGCATYARYCYVLADAMLAEREK